MWWCRNVLLKMTDYLSPSSHHNHHYQCHGFFSHYHYHSSFDDDDESSAMKTFRQLNNSSAKKAIIIIIIIIIIMIIMMVDNCKTLKSVRQRISNKTSTMMAFLISFTVMNIGFFSVCFHSSIMINYFYHDHYHHHCGKKLLKQ